MEEVREGDYLCFKYGSRIVVDKVSELNGFVFTEAGYRIGYEKALKDRISKDEAELLLENRVKKKADPIFYPLKELEINLGQLEELKN